VVRVAHSQRGLHRRYQEILSRLESGYVLLKVNFSDRNKNAAILGTYLKIEGCPFLFTLATKGNGCSRKIPGHWKRVRRPPGPIPGLVG
jgi:hypothetical protein